IGKLTPSTRGSAAAQPSVIDLSRAWAPMEMPLRFPGQYADKETGWFHNHWRTYSPREGRDLQADPIGLAGGVNRFTYVGGDP
ncbi:MAG: RHS repeat-associated core domain-containing protein, partial [Ramlibacter sp.]|uniref:RHS repeat-associated core domain-containing protein n=1 Tax=Ramlibacter sp. TaxID=1917967 RepID=UPI002613382E